MTDKQKTTQDNQGTPFSAGSCMAMMEKMVGQQGCGCAGMMSQMAGQQGQGGCAEMMSQMMPQMMAMFGGAQGEAEEASTAETTRKA